MERKTSSISDGRAGTQSRKARSSCPRQSLWGSVRRPTWLVGAFFAFALLGCGTNVSEILYQTSAAAGRTILDLWLTDLANQLADAAAEDDTPPADDDQDGEGNGDGDGGLAEGADFADLTGDPAAGEPLFASCAGCHCADASGGCLPGATGLIGVNAETHDEFLRGDATHPTKADLTDQEIVDLVAYLDSLGG